MHVQHRHCNLVILFLSTAFRVFTRLSIEQSHYVVGVTSSIESVSQAPVHHATSYTKAPLHELFKHAPLQEL
jgi:hypothetical protein